MGTLGWGGNSKGRKGAVSFSGSGLSLHLGRELETEGGKYKGKGEAELQYRENQNAPLRCAHEKKRQGGGLERKRGNRVEPKERGLTKKRQVA